MNDSAHRKPVDEIVLASAEPLVLGGSTVRPAALEVEHDGAVTTLEPRVMQVLLALARRRGEPVSRDGLIGACWGGRVVSEGAINRSVAQLRKALSFDPRVRIETIAKVGYRLRVEGEPLAQRAALGIAGNGAAPVSIAPAAIRKVLALGVLAVAAAVAVTWSLGLPRPVAWSAVEYRPVTSDPGLEVFPALSPDGKQIVYAARPSANGATDLYLRNLDQGSALQLTSDAGDNYGAAWSPEGDRIAFTRSPPGGPCSLIVTPIPRGPEQVVIHCQTASQTRSSWLDQRTLVFSDAPGVRAPKRIRAVDIQTGATRDLSKPPASARGDSEPAVSPDGRHIVFRRNLLIGADDLFVLDVASGAERALTHDGWKASGYVWSNDSRHVFFSSNRGGEFGLWSADLMIEGPPRQVSLGLGALRFSRMSADRHNRVAMEMVRGRTNLSRVSLSGAIEPVTAGTSNDSYGAAAADGTVAYISNRSGSYQVWITRAGSEPVRVTSIHASYVSAITWSPDGQTLAFVAVTGHRSELYTIARDGSQLRKVTHDGAEKNDPVFSLSGDRLLYLTRVEGRWQLMQVGMTPGSRAEPVDGGQDWVALRADGAGHFYGQRGTTVVSLDSAAPLVDVGLTDLDVWAVGSQGLYVRRGATTQNPSTLWFHPWNGAGRQLAETPSATSSISVDPNGAVIFSQSPDYQVDLGLMELRSDTHS